MSEENKEKKTRSAYQQLSGILNSLKKNEISLNEAMNQIQLKDSKPTRPYCKVTNSGALALYGILNQPIVMYADQWNKLNKLVQNNYIDNYIKYNESRLLYKKKYHQNSDDEDETINTNTNITTTTNSNNYTKNNTYVKNNNYVSKNNNYVNNNKYASNNKNNNYVINNKYIKNKDTPIVPSKIILKKNTYFNDDLIPKNSVSII